MKVNVIYEYALKECIYRLILSIHIHILINMHIQVNMHHACTRTNIPVYAYMYAYTRKYASRYACVHAYLDVYACMYAYGREFAGLHVHAGKYA
jgi:hypothetical protein